MRIVIAPDSLKGSLSSTQASEIIHQAIKDFDPLIETVQIPMADGGEGTVEAVLWNKGGEMINRSVRDPLGRTIEASYGWIEKEKMAIIETAAASGLPLLAPDELDPLLASSYGTGELIKDALDRGAAVIILGLGGSATVDAGTGIFEALGVKFLNDIHQPVSAVGGRLANIARIDLSGLDPRVKTVTFIMASDVTNPLLGKDGAIHIFGPQKGVAETQLAQFEEGMERFAVLVTDLTGRNCIDEAGAGAAGGIGFLFRALLAAEFRSGLEMIAELSKMEKQLENTDLILTAEGRIDGQSLFGKVPVGIARLAKRRDIPVIAFAGSIGAGTEKLETEGVHAVMPIVEGPVLLAEAMANSETLLYSAAMRLMKILNTGKQLKKR